MNRHQIIDIMRQPALLNEQTMSEIKVILDEYPFFQAARMLWIKNLHALDHIRYNNELKLAAVHINDRARLYNLLFDTETSEKEALPTEIHTSKASIAEPDTIEQDDVGDLMKESPLRDVASDYFNVDDTVEMDSGESIDFSTLQLKNHDDEDVIKYAYPQSDENMVLPTADLLDYERADTGFFYIADDEELQLDEYRSFSAWLKVLRQHPLPENETTEEKPVVHGKGAKRDLIDNFLQKGTKGRIRVVADASKNNENEDISLKSLQESEDLMTETLANIYIKQKHFSKAMEIFERLRLKYPEKNIYFARRIKELEEQINNQ